MNLKGLDVFYIFHRQIHNFKDDFTKFQDNSRTNSTFFFKFQEFSRTKVKFKDFSRSVPTLSRNSDLDCHLSPVWRQMAIRNSVSNYFLSTLVDSINVFDCHLSGVKITFPFSLML